MPTMRMPAASGLVVMLLCVLALATGCSSLGPDPSQAASTARRFHAALTGSEPAVACDLLAPATLKGIEDSAHTSCPQAIADAGLPYATTVSTTDTTAPTPGSSWTATRSSWPVSARSGR